jgi:hypothetical protein
MVANNVLLLLTLLIENFEKNDQRAPDRHPRKYATAFDGDDASPVAHSVRITLSICGTNLASAFS